MSVALKSLKMLKDHPIVIGVKINCTSGTSETVSVQIGALEKHEITFGPYRHRV